MSRFLSLFYISLRRILLLSLKLFLFHCLFMPFPAPAFVDSSPVPHVNTSESLASKLVRDFRYVYTHRQKVPASEPAPANPSPVDGRPPQPSASPFDLNIAIAFRKGKWSCTNYPISKFVSYDHLNPIFSPVCSIHVF